MFKLSNIFVLIANIFVQFLTFSFHLYSAASRTGYTICHRPPPLFLFSISFAICAEKSNPAKFFSLAFLPIPAAAAFFYFQNLDTPLLSILPHIFFLKSFISDNLKSKYMSHLGGNRMSCQGYIEVRSWAGVRRKLTETEAGDYFLFTSK